MNKRNKEILAGKPPKLRGLRGAPFLSLCAVGLAFCVQSVCSAANVSVVSGASGSGSAWNNATGKLPSSLVRGNTYYVAGGSYPSYTASSSSGSGTITVKKATAADHGTDTGWNSTYGSNVAVFTGTVTIQQGDFVFDGQTGGGPGSWTSGFGFKIDVSSKTNIQPGLNILNGVSNVTVQHFEVVGNGGDGSQNFPNNDAVGLNAGSNILVSHAYLHDMGRCLFICLAADPLVVEYVYGGKYEYTGSEHSEIASMNGNNQTFRYNVFTNVTGTGGLMFNGSGFDIYGNVFYHPSTDTSWGYAANGIIGAKSNNEPVQNCRVYNNSFINTYSDNTSGGPQIFGFYFANYPGNVVKNNLFYGNNAPIGSIGGSVVHDYNGFVSFSGSSVPAETHGYTASGNPFVNYPGLDFRLTANTPAGTNVGTTYAVDYLRDSRATWTRGALEYTSGSGGTTVVAPANAKTSISIP